MEIDDVGGRVEIDRFRRDPEATGPFGAVAFGMKEETGRIRRLHDGSECP